MSQAQAAHITEVDDGFLRREATIINSRGLHARAAAKFVKLVETFEAEVVVTNRGQEVSGRSIMGLMMLAASPGTTIELRARGTDSRQVLEAIGTLIDDKFYED